MHLCYFKNKHDEYLIFIFVHQKSFKAAFKNGYSVHNNYLNLCGQVKNSKSNLCRFLMYKYNLNLTLNHLIKFSGTIFEKGVRHNFEEIINKVKLIICFYYYFYHLY